MVQTVVLSLILATPGVPGEPRSGRREAELKHVLQSTEFMLLALRLPLKSGTEKHMRLRGSVPGGHSGRSLGSQKISWDPSLALLHVCRLVKRPFELRLISTLNSVGEGRGAIPGCAQEPCGWGLAAHTNPRTVSPAQSRL